MPRYSEEQKQAVLERMMPPENRTVTEIARDTGITETTLYNWRKEARSKGLVVPGKTDNTEQWSSAAKFAVVLEVAAMNEAELAEYCRAKGLYVEQVKRWREACGSFQGSCRVNRYAACCVSSRFLRSGFSQTSVGIVQSRYSPLQRFGCLARAAA